MFNGWVRTNWVRTNWGQNKLGQNKLGQNKLSAVAGGASLVGDIALNKRCTAGTAVTHTSRRQLRYVQSMLDPRNTTHVLFS